MIRKLDNRGLTLVELVIAISIATMIVGVAAMFLYNAQKTYRVAEHTINLQMEAQIVMEQMSNWVLESNRIYCGTDTVNAANGNDVLVLYYIPRDNNRDTTDVYPLSYAGNSKKASKKVIFCVNGKLYMKESNDSIDNAMDEFNALVAGTSATPIYSSADVTEENQIGECVLRFNVEKEPSSATLNELKAVKVLLDMEEGTQSYSAMDTYSMRNGLFKGATASEESSTESSD